MYKDFLRLGMFKLYISLYIIICIYLYTCDKINYIYNMYIFMCECDKLCIGIPCVWAGAHSHKYSL
jgi:hypothetical protein